MANVNTPQTLTGEVANLVVKKDSGRSEDNYFANVVSRNAHTSNADRIHLSCSTRQYDTDGVTATVSAGAVTMDHNGTNFADVHVVQGVGLSEGSKDSVRFWGDYAVTVSPGANYYYSESRYPEPGFSTWTMTDVGRVLISKRQTGGSYSVIQTIYSPFLDANPPLPGNINDPYKDDWVLIASFTHRLDGAGEQFGTNAFFTKFGKLVVSSRCQYPAMSYPSGPVPTGRFYVFSYDGGQDRWVLDDYIQNPTPEANWEARIVYGKHVVAGFGDYLPQGDAMSVYDITNASISTVQAAMPHTDAGEPGVDITLSPDRIGYIPDGDFIGQIIIGVPDANYDAAGANLLTDAGAFYEYRRSQTFGTANKHVSNSRGSGRRFGDFLAVSGSKIFARSQTSYLLEAYTITTAGAVTYRDSTTDKIDADMISMFACSKGAMIIHPHTLDSSNWDYLPNEQAATLLDLDGSNLFYNAQLIEGTTGVLQTYTGGVAMTDGLWQDRALGSNITMDRSDYTIYVQAGGGAMYDDTESTYRPWFDFSNIVQAFSLGQDGNYTFDPAHQFPTRGENRDILRKSDVQIGDGMQVHGDWAFIGAHRNGGEHEVMVYKKVFGVWTFQHHIIHPSGTANDFGRYGLSYDSDNQVLCVSSLDSLRVYVYTYNTGNSTWERLQTIAPFDNSQSFGTSISADSGALFVGAPNQDYDENGQNYMSNAGAVYIYNWNGSAYAFHAKQCAAIRRSEGNYGHTVKVLANQAVVGHPGDDYDDNQAWAQDRAGSVEVWSGSYGVWSRMSRMARGTQYTYRNVNDEFGDSVILGQGVAFIHRADTTTDFDYIKSYGASWVLEQRDYVTGDQGVWYDNVLSAADSDATVSTVTGAGQINLSEALGVGFETNYGAMLMFTGM